MLNLWIPLGFLAVGIILLAWAFLQASKRPTPVHSLNVPSRLFLIALRLVIGWHFLIEGMDKLQNPSWSAEVYLREAVGPLAPAFRRLAGDSLRERTSTPNDKLAPALQGELDRYREALAAHYELDEEQKKLVQTNAELLQKSMVDWLKSSKMSATVYSIIPTLNARQDLTLAERFVNLDKAEALLRSIQDEQMDAEQAEKWATYLSAKNAANKTRSDIKRDLDEQIAFYKESLLLQAEELKQRLDKKPAKSATKPGTDEKKEVWTLTALDPVVPAKSILSATQKTRPPLRDPIPTPLAQWNTLDWANRLVTYSLIGIGGCLLLGLFSRLSALAGAGLVLSFYLAMPALPWYPENPKAEGHYLFINKNIIEMFALLALASLPTGKWLGLDGLLRCCCSPSRKTPATSNLA